MSGQYSLQSIVLLENHFKREPKISYELKSFETKTNITTGYQEKDNELFVTLRVEFSAGVEDNQEINISTEILGLFIKPKNPTVPIENFARINAPAIIFPFVREHIASLSLKAGLQPILLPPINFLELVKKHGDLTKNK